jgi:hypothetical protein
MLNSFIANFFSVIAISKSEFLVGKLFRALLHRFQIILRGKAFSEAVFACDKVWNISSGKCERREKGRRKVGDKFSLDV